MKKLIKIYLAWIVAYLMISHCQAENNLQKTNENNYSINKYYLHTSNWLTRKIKKNPNDAKYYYINGIINLLINNYPASIDNFNRAIELAPNKALYYIVVSNALIESDKNHNLDRISDISTAIQKARKIDNNSALLHYVSAKLNYQKLYNYKDSLKDIHKAIELRPQTGAFYELAGDMLKHANSDKEALTYYQKQLILGYNVPYAYCQISKIYEDLKNFPKAKLNFNHAIKAINTKYTISDDLWLGNDISALPKEQMSNLINIINLKKNSQAYFLIGQNYLFGHIYCKQNYKLALKYFDQALAIYQYNSDVYDAIILLASKIGRQELAYIDKYFSENPKQINTNIKLIFQKGLFNYALESYKKPPNIDKINKSLKLFKKVSQLNPNYPGINEFIARCQNTAYSNLPNESNKSDDADNTDTKSILKDPIAEYNCRFNEKLYVSPKQKVYVYQK